MPGFNPNRSEAGQGTADDPLGSYVQSIPEVYRDILKAYPEVEPGRRPGYGLAVQTMHAHLGGKYDLGTIAEACQEMERNGVVEIRHGIFVHPTALGERIIAHLTGRVAREKRLPAFPEPPSALTG